MAPGACVVVRRGDEVLVLRRVQHHDNGDWQWTPPSGLLEPGETPDEAAERELREETGLQLPLWQVGENEYVTVFACDAPHDASVVLSDEHDEYAWLPLEDACARCLPAVVADELRMGAQ